MLLHCLAKKPERSAGQAGGIPKYRWFEPARLGGLTVANYLWMRPLPPIWNKFSQKIRQSAEKIMVMLKEFDLKTSIGLVQLAFTPINLRSEIYRRLIPLAKVAESADALDSKSSVLNRRVGSIPTFGIASSSLNAGFFASIFDR